MVNCGNGDRFKGLNLYRSLKCAIFGIGNYDVASHIRQILHVYKVIQTLFNWNNNLYTCNILYTYQNVDKGTFCILHAKSAVSCVKINNYDNVVHPGLAYYVILIRGCILIFEGMHVYVIVLMYRLIFAAYVFQAGLLLYTFVT